MASRHEKTYDVWFLSSKKHTRMVVYYHGGSLSLLKARALARRLNKKREHKAVVLPRGHAPPEHTATPDWKFRIGQRVVTRSCGPGVVESRQRNFDWSGADDLYRVRVGHTLHLLGATQIVSGEPRKVTVRRRRDASRPPPLPSAAVRQMTGMLTKAGYPRPASSAQRLAAEGIGPAELAFRLRVDSRPPARSKARRRPRSRSERARRDPSKRYFVLINTSEFTPESSHATLAGAWAAAKKHHPGDGAWVYTSETDESGNAVWEPVSASARSASRRTRR